MKKLTFALACASAVAAFAAAEDSAVISLIDFDAYTAGFKGLSLAGDDGGEVAVTDSRWLYDGGTAGATDSSTVKAYDPAKTGNPNYLELSTEGGTLWRSINTLGSSEESGAALGAAQAVPADTGLYIDTMVQFTPTEDGGDPTLDPTTDKLAIWLNVKDNVTNLCVKAGFIDDNGTSTSCKPKTYILTGAGDINPATWYRLKVKSIADSTKCMAKNPTAYDTGYLGFQIYLNNQLLTATEDTIGSGYVELALDAGQYGWLNETDDAATVALMRSKTLFPCLLGAETSATLQAVGFKGSGAIDSLQFTTQDPGGSQEPDPAPVKVELSISAGNATVTGITAGEVEVGSNLTFTVTAAEGYNLTGVTINGTTVTANTEGNYTYTVKTDDTAVAVVVTTEAIPQIDWDHPDTSAGTTAGDMFKLTGPIAAADGAKVATWAKKYSVSFADASTIEMDAFLLNCANTVDDINTAKANFKIVSIEQNAQGAWVAKVTGDVGDGGEFGNGYVEIKGSATVDAAKYELETTDPTARFFKAFLVLEAPAAK